MDNSVINVIVKEKESIIALLNALEKKKNKVFEESILSRNVRGHVRFYLRTPDGKETYIRKENLDIVSQINQSKYDNEAKEILQKRLSVLRKVEAEYKLPRIDNLYDSCSSKGRIEIQPIKLTDKMFAKKWFEQNLIEQNFGKGEYETKSGIFVRSKTEKIIADELFDNDIIFVYETQIKLLNGAVVRPDFCILDLKTRSTIIWEHFGIMNDVDYIRETYMKMVGYFESGYVRGETFIYSTEGITSDISKQIKNNIDWLLNGGKWQHAPMR